MKVQYFVFSGTGNTLRAAQYVGDSLKAAGSEVIYSRMEKNNSPSIDDDAVVGLAFPTAFFSTYPTVLDFIDSLPDGKGRKMFITATMAGTDMGAHGFFRALARKRGYALAGACTFLMPSNYGDGMTDEAKNQKQYDAAAEKARLFAEGLERGTAKWGRGLPLIPTLWNRLIRSGLALRLFYKKFPLQVDEKKCTRCLRCFKICPAHAISVYNDVPVIKAQLCESCQRCAGFCPVHAIMVPGHHSMQYRAMDFEKFNDLLKS